MSRKRKPLLQLGGSSSKLHKYGYSKEFCAKDEKGKSNLSSLVGSYSDSDGEATPDEGNARQTSEADVAIDGKQPTGNHVDTPAEADSRIPQSVGKSQDMDDELKNFLSEIEAIPMPDDGGDVTSTGVSHDPAESVEENLSTPQPALLDKDEVTSKGDEIQVNSNTQDSNLPSSKATTKSRYSMFVQGESEFTKKRSPSPEVKTKDAKVEKTVQPSDFKIPEEPTTQWQLVQDETSQYFYYWNTLTNEVTWDIPTEYTQFLLLHREYTDKIAKLPPELQQAHKDKNSREAEAALHLQQAECQQESADRKSSTAATSSTRAKAEPSEPSSPHQIPEKKHKREKKRRRHKHRHSDSDGDLSDAGSGANSRGSPAVMEYGPQLPQPKQESTKSAAEPASNGPSGTTQLMSIVPYLSDDDDADTDQIESDNTNMLQSGSVVNSKEMAPGENGMSLSTGECGKSDQGQVATASDMVPKVARASTKKEEKKIDMFAEYSFTDVKTDIVSEATPKDLAVKIEQVSKVKVPKSHDDGIKDEDAISNKVASTSESLHVISKDNIESLEKFPDKDVLKTFEPETEDNKGEIFNASKFVNIVGYSSGDEEASKLKSEAQSDAMPKESEQPSKSLLATASGSKKKKKEKRKHKHEEREEEEKAEAMEGVLANIVKGHLGKDMVARVTDTLDQEISDIVVQTVCKTNSLASVERRDVEIPKIGKGSLKDQEGRKDAKETSNSSGETVTEQPGELVQSLTSNQNVKGNDEDDEDDIDFEDLDDIDRALEVALEKKKIELAKYEEGERKQQISANALDNRDQPIAEDLVTNDRNEISNEEEEKMKEEVKDAAELALNKLEFLDISADSLTRLQVLFIELQTRLQDWNAGGLSTSYFQEQLAVAQGLLEHYELSAVPNGWACQWDRGNNRYYYRNLTTNRIQWDYPDDEKAKDVVPESEGASEKLEQVAEEKSSKSSSRSERTRDRDKPGKEVEDLRDDGRKKGSRSSRRRKRDDRDKERGSKYKRRDSSNSSHHYRKKRRRKRDHSSSSSSSSDGGADNSSSKKQHRHHHKISSKKKKKRRSRSSRSPSVQVVDVSDQERTSLEKKNGDVVSADITVIEASPTGSSVDRSPAPDSEAHTSSSAVLLEVAPGVSNDKSLAESSETTAGVASLNSMATDEAVPSETVDDNAGVNSSKEDEEEEENEAITGKEKGAIVKAAVIYKPPQIVMPSQPIVTTQQPEPYIATQAVSSQEIPAGSEDPRVPEGSVTENPVEPEEDTDKQSKKKKKEKKLATGSSLLMKKKHMSSMVQKWQKVKKEVEKEDRAKELRQAAIRKKIEELK